MTEISRHSVYFNSCPLCGGAVRRIGGADARDFFACPDCDLISVPRAQHLSNDDQRKRYALHHNTLDNAGYVAMLERFIDRLGRHLTPPARVLDYGCGVNRILVQLLERKEYRAAGYDPLYEIGRNLNGPYDAVISTEVFEHFARPRDEVESIRRLLEPNGLLAVSTSFHPAWERMPEWWYGRDPAHVALYSQTTMRWIAANIGFEIIELDEKNWCVLRRTA